MQDIELKTDSTNEISGKDTGEDTEGRVQPCKEQGPEAPRSQFLYSHICSTHTPLGEVQNCRTFFPSLKSWSLSLSSLRAVTVIPLGQRDRSKHGTEACKTLAP